MVAGCGSILRKFNAVAEAVGMELSVCHLTYVLYMYANIGSAGIDMLKNINVKCGSQYCVMEGTWEETVYL